MHSFNSVSHACLGCLILLAARWVECPASPWSCSESGSGGAGAETATSPWFPPTVSGHVGIQEGEGGRRVLVQFLSQQIPIRTFLWRICATWNKTNSDNGNTKTGTKVADYLLPLSGSTFFRWKLLSTAISWASVMFETLLQLLSSYPGKQSLAKKPALAAARKKKSFSASFWFPCHHCCCLADSHYHFSLTVQ